MFQTDLTVIPHLHLSHCAAMTADRFFRVDRGQEKLQFITDVHTEDIYILDPEMKPQVSKPACKALYHSDSEPLKIEAEELGQVLIRSRAHLSRSLTRS